MNKTSLAAGLLLTLLSTATCYSQGQTAPGKQVKPVLQPPMEKDGNFIPIEKLKSPQAPNTIVRTISQEGNGDIWLSTFSGLFRYDGTNFINVTKQKGLPKNRMFSRLVDSKGRVWHGSVWAGVFRFDGDTPFQLTSEDGLAGNKVEAMLEDAEGRFWFGTENGISVYDGKTVRNLTLNAEPKDNDVHAMAFDDEGRLWVGASGGVFLLKGETFTPVKAPDGKAFENVRTIMTDSKGRIWFGGNDGIWRHDGQGLTQFSSGFGGYLFEDRAGNLWAASSSAIRGEAMGLYRYAPEAQEDPAKWQTVEPVANSTLIFSAFEDRDGRIWFGYLNGVGRYDGETVDYFGADPDLR